VISPRPDTPAAPAPIRWGLGDFTWVWLVTIVGQIILGVVVIVARGGANLAPGHTYQTDAIDIAVITAGSALLTVGLLRAFVAPRGRGRLRTDFGLTVRVGDWPWLLAGLGLQAVALGMAVLIEAVAGSEPKQEVVKALQHSGTAAKLLGAIAVVAFAPVAEELLFRGVLLRGLLRRYSAPVAVVAGGLVFAVVHLVDPSAAPLLAPLAMVGIVSGVVAVRTGDLSRSILLHAGFNLLSAVLLFTT
jgi:membrane protease YdiL (CAAX protease family)